MAAAELAFVQVGGATRACRVDHFEQLEDIVPRGSLECFQP